MLNMSIFNCTLIAIIQLIQELITSLSPISCLRRTHCARILCSDWLKHMNQLALFCNASVVRYTQSMKVDSIVDFEK